jgi:hypothetical protein
LSLGQWGSLVYPRGFGTLGPRFESALSHYSFYVCFVYTIFCLYYYYIFAAAASLLQNFCLLAREVIDKAEAGRPRSLK